MFPCHCYSNSQQTNSGYPRHRGNRENGQKKSLSGKTQGIWKFCQNTGKTQGILFAQVENPLILQVKDIVIFASKISIFSRSWIGLPSVCNSHKSCKLAQGKFAVGQGKHRDSKIQFESVPCISLGSSVGGLYVGTFLKIHQVAVV